MSDDRLRKLERVWQESGAEEDGEAFLREKLRQEGWSLPRAVLDLSLGTALASRGHFLTRPTVAQLVTWLDHRCLPCSDCNGPAGFTDDRGYRRVCEPCEARRREAHAAMWAPWAAQIARITDPQPMEGE